jgi:hypothetical protein
VPIDRDAAAVIDDRDRVVDVDGDVDLVAVTGKRLVDRVVVDLLDQVVQTGHTGGTDVHGWPLANGLETLEDLDLVGAVVVHTLLQDGVRLVSLLLSRFFHSSPLTQRCCQIRIGMMT